MRSLASVLWISQCLFLFLPIYVVKNAFQTSYTLGDKVHSWKTTSLGLMGLRNGVLPAISKTKTSQLTKAAATTDGELLSILREFRKKQ